MNETKQEFFDRLDQKVKDNTFSTQDYYLIGRVMNLSKQQVKNWVNEWAKSRKVVRR